MAAKRRRARALAYNAERSVMQVLLDHDPALCSPEEIAAEIGDRIAAEDGIAALERSGLARRVSGLVMLTRAAVLAHRLR